MLWPSARRTTAFFQSDRTPSRPRTRLVLPFTTDVFTATTVTLATWRLAIDDSRAVDGEPFLLATARPAVALMSPATAAAAGLADAVTVSNDRGAVTLPLQRDPDMVDGVVWLPTKAPGLGIAVQERRGARRAGDGAARRGGSRPLPIGRPARLASPGPG